MGPSWLKRDAGRYPTLALELYGLAALDASRGRWGAPGPLGACLNKTNTLLLGVVQAILGRTPSGSVRPPENSWSIISPIMRIAIVGSGGVGGYFGGRLAATGADVTFVARGAHLAALRERGLRIDSLRATTWWHACSATDDPATIGPVDIVFFTVKLYDTDEAARMLPPLIGPTRWSSRFRTASTASPR